MYAKGSTSRRNRLKLWRAREFAVTQADWNKRIEQLRSRATGRRQNTKALAEIEALNDPGAADAVVAVLRRENNPDFRRLWIERQDDSTARRQSMPWSTFR